MCASASDEEPAEVQSYADRPLMFTDRESKKLGDKGATTLAPEADVMDTPVDLSGMDQILKQLESIQKGTPKNIVVLGTRHCSLLHQQIIELLSYALVLSTPAGAQKSACRPGTASKAAPPRPPTHRPMQTSSMGRPIGLGRASVGRVPFRRHPLHLSSHGPRRLTAALPPPYRPLTAHPQATTTSTPRARRARTPPPSAVGCDQRPTSLTPTLTPLTIDPDPDPGLTLTLTLTHPRPDPGPSSRPDPHLNPHPHPHSNHSPLTTHHSPLNLHPDH